MKSSMKPVGGHRQQGRKCLRLLGSLVMILTALNIMKSIKVKQAYESPFGDPSQQELLDEPAASLVSKPLWSHIVKKA
jgi:hypothetical protein